MAHKLDQILVIDVEATCWEGDPPPGEEYEIIEIGLTLLAAGSGERHDKRSILVRPERSTVSPFCTQLTTLTQEQVLGGISFREACALLRNEYRAGDRAWASYGDYDRNQFARQCEDRTLPYPFGPTHFNVKSLFALTRALPREVGLDEAMRLAELPFEGRPHRGSDDAWNIARLLSTLLLAARR
jgi:inhibitor of KinA sporulation pathway (predicted exonuclease)